MRVTNKEVIFWFADWVQLLRTLPSDLRKLNSRLHTHENPQRSGRKRLQTADSLRYAAAVIVLCLGFGFSLLAFVLATNTQDANAKLGYSTLEIFSGTAALIFGLLLLRKSIKK